MDRIIRQSGNTAPFIILFSIFYFLFSFSLAFAVSVSATPAVFDYKGYARDIIKGQVTLVNDTLRVAEMYPFVYGISADSGRQEFLDPSKADHAVSLANWIEITRSSILIKPGGREEIPFSIDVNLRAPAGNYHAVLVFAQGSTRSDAERNVRQGASATVNLEVLEDIKERMQLLKFAPEKTLSWGFPVSFLYSFKNIGNRDAVPSGEIRVYDRRDEEIASFPVNEEKKNLALDETAELSASWKGRDGDSRLASIIFGAGAFGRYKAVLDIAYGAKEPKTLQDTAIFWVVPLPRILLIFVITALLVGGSVHLLHRRVSRRRNSGEVTLHTKREDGPSDPAQGGPVHLYGTSAVVDLRHPESKVESRI